MALIKKKISKHPQLKCDRELVVTGFRVIDNDILYGNQVIFEYHINYSVDGEKIDLQIPIKPWTINNLYEAVVRDKNFNEVRDARGDVVKMKAYDYFKKLTFDNDDVISIKKLLEYYIVDNDSKKFFD